MHGILFVIIACCGIFSADASPHSGCLEKRSSETTSGSASMSEATRALSEFCSRRAHLNRLEKRLDEKERKLSVGQHSATCQSDKGERVSETRCFPHRNKEFSEE